MANDWLTRYPAIADLEKRARRRMPRFAWEFLDSGTGSDEAARRNVEAFSRVRLTPRFMRGEFKPDTATRLFGTDYTAPFGVAPVGMNGLFWPGTDLALARAAGRHGIPYSMSTAANETPETLGPAANGMGWFQLYPPRNPNMRADLLGRVREAGFTTVLVTVDVPVISRRERQVRAGVGGGFRITPRMVMESMLRPAWARAMLARGTPGLPTLEKYQSADDMQRFLSFIGEELNGTFDWEYLSALRKEWDGPLVIKGVLHPDEAAMCVEHGADGILVSNHGGRQLDGAPASIEALPAIAEAVGDRAAVLLDSGARSGLDVARAIASGADFVLMGRAFMCAVAALGEAGADHAMTLLAADLRNVMSNLGCANIAELRDVQVQVRD